MNRESQSPSFSSLRRRLRAVDPTWYLLTYPEATGEIDGGKIRDVEDHYWHIGLARRWSPNALYFEPAYLEHNPDVAGAVERGEYRSGFEHFLSVGLEEGRLFSELDMDEEWYRQEYPGAVLEVEQARFRNVLDHYLACGAARGYSPHEAFDETYYRERYFFVDTEIRAGRFLSGYQHYLREGIARELRPHPSYSPEVYLSFNPDLEIEHREGRLPSVYRHLIRSGLKEDRTWTRDARQEDVKGAATRIAAIRVEEFLASERRLAFSAGASPSVSVLLVLFNRVELTYQCLESIQALEGVALEVVVVDNNSTDRTSELLDRLDGVRVIRNRRNEGFVKAANLAAKKATGTHLLFLNNDTELLPDSLRSAVHLLESEPDIGAVGGRIVDLAGRLQEAGSIVWRDGTTEGYGRGDDPQSGAYLFPREVDYCSGVFLLTRQEVFWKLGGFDTAFEPAYYEESDYCFRLRQAGLRVLYDPGSVVLHYETASLENVGSLKAYLKRNRPRFVQRHGPSIKSSWAPDLLNMFAAGNRGRFRSRILVMDDFVPLERFGGGSPRMQEILRLLTGLGLFVTFFAANPSRASRREIEKELPVSDHLELIDHLHRGLFLDFWKYRRDAYDTLVISRPHNFRHLLDLGLDPKTEHAQVIYDAEAVFARRGELRRKVRGAEAETVESLELEEELALARRAEHIWAVTEEEGKLLAGSGQRMSVIGHCAKGQPGLRPFGERKGALFVGRLEEEHSPNVDALRWYLEEIHPRLCDRLEELIPLTVVGKAARESFPDSPETDFVGYVDDLQPVYDAHRIFVAPTRFAAGIPHKVTGAATHGVPSVATSLLVRQLGWSDGVEIVDGGEADAERFAAQAARLYTQEDLWLEVRSNSLARVAREQSRDAIRSALIGALDLED